MTIYKLDNDSAFGLVQEDGSINYLKIVNSSTIENQSSNDIQCNNTQEKSITNFSIRVKLNLNEVDTQVLSQIKPNTVQNLFFQANGFPYVGSCNIVSCVNKKEDNTLAIVFVPKENVVPVINGGSGGLTTVSHDSTLKGNGTSTAPLGVVNPANDSTITLKGSDGSAIDSFTTNQSTNKTITIPVSSGGLKVVEHDSTLSGDGTSTNPLEVTNPANNPTITLKKTDGTTIDSFTLNQSTNKDITIPTDSGSSYTSNSLDISNDTIEIKSQEQNSAITQTEGKFDVKIDGTTITKSSDGTLSAISGSGGTTDYNQLTNRPLNQTGSELGATINGKVKLVSPTTQVIDSTLALANGQKLLGTNPTNQEYNLVSLGEYSNYEQVEIGTEEIQLCLNHKVNPANNVDKHIIVNYRNEQGVLNTEKVAYLSDISSGGLTTVSHDNSLQGDGTPTDKLKVFVDNYTIQYSDNLNPNGLTVNALNLLSQNPLDNNLLQEGVEQLNSIMLQAWNCISQDDNNSIIEGSDHRLFVPEFDRYIGYEIDIDSGITLVYIKGDANHVSPTRTYHVAYGKTTYVTGTYDTTTNRTVYSLPITTGMFYITTQNSGSALNQSLVVKTVYLGNGGSSGGLSVRDFINTTTGWQVSDGTNAFTHTDRTGVTHLNGLLNDVDVYCPDGSVTIGRDTTYNRITLQTKPFSETDFNTLFDKQRVDFYLPKLIQTFDSTTNRATLELGSDYIPFGRVVRQGAIGILPYDATPSHKKQLVYCTNVIDDRHIEVEDYTFNGGSGTDTKPTSVTNKVDENNDWITTIGLSDGTSVVSPALAMNFVTQSELLGNISSEIYNTGDGFRCEVHDKDTGFNSSFNFSETDCQIAFSVARNLQAASVMTKKDVDSAIANIPTPTDVYPTDIINEYDEKTGEFTTTIYQTDGTKNISSKMITLPTIIYRKTLYAIERQGANRIAFSWNSINNSTDIHACFNELREITTNDSKQGFPCSGGGFEGEIIIYQFANNFREGKNDGLLMTLAGINTGSPDSTNMWIDGEEEINETDWTINIFVER